MAKLTLTFHGKPIKTLQCEPGVTVHIGSDDSNPICIEDVGVAPIHAVIIFDQQAGDTIKQLNEQFPVIINDKKASRQLLKNGDKIAIGNHLLIYQNEKKPPIGGGGSGDTTLEEDFLDKAIFHTQKDGPDTANFQLLSGRHIGRVVPLKRGMTRLGKPGAGVVVVAKRKDGYYLSPLEGEELIKVNSAPLGEGTIKLSNGDMLEIDDAVMQFFTG